MRLSYWPLYYESSNTHLQTINKPEYKLAKNRLIKYAINVLDLIYCKPKPI